MSIHFLKLGELFKAHAFIRKERTPAWAVALGLALYFQGLSLRRSALILAQLGVRVSHVAIWYWIQAFALKCQVWQGTLPKRIVVDETLVKLGGRRCWIWAAIDPNTRRVLYLRVSRDRHMHTTMRFFQELADTYGCWPEQAVVDGGPWYQGALFRLGKTQRTRMCGGIRNYVERHFRELKRRTKVFDTSFPQRKLRHHSISSWLKGFAWHYNQNLVLKRLFNIS